MGVDPQRQFEEAVLTDINRGARAGSHEAGLEYILDMMEQLAEMAGDIGERQLGAALHSAADLRRDCTPVHLEQG